MAKGDPGLFVEYCAKDFLDAAQFLDPWEELAYRRICDLIYTSNNNLKDDDRMLAWATRSGRRWPQIKIALTSGEKPKLVIVDGRLTNKRCTDALATAARKIAQKAIAGRASSETGKSLTNLKQHRTDVGKPVPNGAPNEPPNLPTKPLNQVSDSPDGESAPSSPVAPDPMKEFWSRGVAALGNSSRSLIGKCRKEYGEVAVMEAIVTVENEHPMEPVEFFIGCLKQRKSGNGRAHQPTARDTLFRAGLEAAEAVYERQRLRGALAEPLLDGQ